MFGVYLLFGLVIKMILHSSNGIFQLTHRQAVDELFSNITWTFGQAEDLNEEEIISHWKHPDTNIYINLVLFIVMNVSFKLTVYFHLSFSS